MCATSTGADGEVGGGGAGRGGGGGLIRVKRQTKQLQDVLHTLKVRNPKWARQEQINSRLLEIQQEQEAHGHAVDRRLAVIERDQDILHRRVHALELHVFNRSYPPPEEGLLRAAWPFTNDARLANRVASLERAAMTIPVGTTVNIVNPGGPLHDDDSDVVNESEVEWLDESSEDDE